MLDPEEVSALSRRVIVIRIRSITDRHWLSPPSFTRSAIIASCEVITLAGAIRAYHVSQM
jgi:hypothetical protein